MEFGYILFTVWAQASEDLEPEGLEQTVQQTDVGL